MVYFQVGMIPRKKPVVKEYGQSPTNNIIDAQVQPIIFYAFRKRRFPEANLKGGAFRDLLWETA
ncbi:MAG: hypothetical protein A2Z06_05015 [Candidatus Glassbacteria bacterium RBG_16_58_8]|uniref:Uncharacterized protein n=1 Tax=Candidatus Glassbacteria bacterium RBG_16_58_8 TaxID=1817866 RepID=A0A1F5YD67_9BACT|nr:MAG: hypothetical protein A2Z06_05015 [Candidatus Glassbacteria bacterium RBG_16_58_8]